MMILPRRPASSRVSATRADLTILPIGCWLDTGTPTITSEEASSSVEGALEFEPVEAIGPQCQEVRLLRDDRKFGVSEHFSRSEAGKPREVEQHRLHDVRQVGDAQDRVRLVSTKVHQHRAVLGLEKLEAAAAEDLEEASKADHVPHPLEEPGRIALLRSTR